MGNILQSIILTFPGSHDLSGRRYVVLSSDVYDPVGHEIVGDAVHIGPSVTLVKKGQRVGVGAEVLSCFTCPECTSDHEQYCANQVETYNARYADGTPSYGGFANYVRVHERFLLLLFF